MRDERGARGARLPRVPALLSQPPGQRLLAVRVQGEPPVGARAQLHGLGRGGPGVQLVPEHARVKAGGPGDARGHRPVRAGRDGRGHVLRLLRPTVHGGQHLGAAPAVRVLLPPGPHALRERRRHVHSLR